MKLLLIGAAENCPDFMKYASSHGHDVTVIAEKNWRSACSFDALHFDDVVAFSETGQIYIEKIKTHWRKPSRGEALIAKLTNKKLLREDANLSTILPEHIIIPATIHASKCASLVIAKALKFPLVVKPAYGFYSAGVSRIETIDALPRAVSIARRINNQIVGAKGDVILESYLSGVEIAIDGMIYQGEIYPFVHHTKHPKLAGPFFHEEAYFSQTLRRRGEEFATLKAFIQQLGLTSGPFHIEMRQNQEGHWKLLECAPRFSGMGLSTNTPFHLLTNKYAYDFLLCPQQLKDHCWVNSQECVVEFDFSVRNDGVLAGMNQLLAKIARLPNSEYYSYVTDGDFVFAPPNNLNTILTVFTRLPSKADAIYHYQTLKQLESELKCLTTTPSNKSQEAKL
jgi:hypothetical protein